MSGLDFNMLAPGDELRSGDIQLEAHETLEASMMDEPEDTDESMESEGPEMATAPFTSPMATHWPPATLQLLATMTDKPTACPRPFGIARDVDTDVGCSTSEVYMRMLDTERSTHRRVPNPKHLRVRRVLVDWLCEVGEGFRLQKSTVHVAVGYVDRILQDVSIARNRLLLVALCCLLVAAKYEEEEAVVPSVAQALEYSQVAYSPVMVNQMEVLVLTRLDWKLTVVTPLHFLGYFQSKGTLFETDTMQNRRLVPKVPPYLKKYCDFFAELCLQEYDFQQYPPSLLAASILAAARRALSIRPLWCEAVTHLVGYSPAEIAECFTHLWNHYLKCYPQEGRQADIAHAKYWSPDNVMDVDADTR